MEQKAYEIVDKVFQSFVDNNQVLMEQIEERTLYSFHYDKKQDTWYIENDDVSKNLYGTYCIRDPWNVRHIVMLPCHEGAMLVFLTEDFDKLYQYDLRI